MTSHASEHLHKCLPGDTLNADARIAMLEQALRFAELRCAKLRYTVDVLLRRLYGPKSDKIDSGQLALLKGEIDADTGVAGEHPPTATPTVESTAKAAVAKKKRRWAPPGT